MNFEQIDVTTLLPQQPPFVLIDHLLQYEEKTTTTSLQVREENMFVEDGQLNPCAYVENIAQTCAARLGYINKYIYHRDVCIGFIGAVRNLVVLRSAHVGEKLTTTITVREEVMQLTLVDAIVQVGEETVCTAEMKIAVSVEN
ncbi:MAG: pseudouridylate synthase [Prevotella sp.]|nr:pseudouridylate synthase [Prevotella sp.]MBR3480633.1 pseudouridylate synthase [Prevotella sp.]MBR6187997.1 pseudouridylate synthase [Prevotella sp.]